MYFDEAYAAHVQAEFDQAFKQLTELPSVNKASFAIKHRKQLLYFRSKIPNVLAILTPEDQLAFLLGSSDQIDKDDLETIVKHISLAEHKAQFIAVNEDKITETNLVAIALLLFSEAQDRLTWILARVNKVTVNNFCSTIQIIPETARGKFIADHASKRMSKYNIVGIVDFITYENLWAFLNIYSEYIGRENLASLALKIPQAWRLEFYNLHKAKIFSGNMSALTGLLSEVNRLDFTSSNKAAIDELNLASVICVLPDESRLTGIVNNKQLLSAKNLAAVTKLLPEAEQLGFLTSNQELLTGQYYAIWLESAGALSNKADRYTFISPHLEKLINATDVFSMIWIMEILSEQDALNVARSNMHIVNTAADLVLVINCKLLNFTDKLTLIELYMPTMEMKSTHDRGEEAFKVRGWLATNLSALTGEKYLRGKNSDMAALKILLGQAKQYVPGTDNSSGSSYGTAAINSNPKIFGASDPTQSAALAAAATRNSVNMEIEATNRATIT